MLTPTLQAARRIVVAVVGSTVILIGVALLVLPGPGWVVIFAGLGILATEFVWARRLLQRARSSATSLYDKVCGKPTSDAEPPVPADDPNSLNSAACRRGGS